MEKYRKFADAKYGINPFLPITPKGVNKFFKYTIGFLIMLLRLPIALTILFNLFLYESVTKKIITINSLQKLLIKALATTCGFTDYKVLPKFNAKDMNRPKFEPGHVILSNHTHPLDFLYYSQICSPTFVKLFVKTSPNGEKEVLLAPLDFQSTLKYFFSREFSFPVTGDQSVISSQPLPTFKLAELANTTFKKNQGPIVIFFEGATTNGKGVLEMHESLTHDIFEYQKESNRETVVAALSYKDNASATVSSPLKATLSLMMNVSNHVTVRLCSITKLPIQKKDMPRTIFDVYENIHELPKMALKSEDYQAFLEYWKATQKKNYIAKDSKGQKDL